MDTTRLRPLLRKDTITGIRDIGFLNLDKGIFEVERIIEHDFEIDKFMEEHDICFVPIVKMHP